MPKHRTPHQLAAHAAESREYRRRLANHPDDPLGPRGRAHLLRMVRSGLHIHEAANRRGISVTAVWERARMLPEWGDELDQVLTSRRDPGISHGTEWSYRVHRCRCPDCRAAKRRYR